MLDIWKFSPGVGLRGMTLSVKRKSDGYSGVLTNDDNARDGHISDLYYYSLDIESPSWMLSRYIGVSLRSQTQRIDNSVGPIVYYQWLGERILFEVTFASVSFSHNGYESTMGEFTAIAGITF